MVIATAAIPAPQAGVIPSPCGILRGGWPAAPGPVRSCGSGRVRPGNRPRCPPRRGGRDAQGLPAVRHSHRSFARQITLALSTSPRQVREIMYGEKTPGLLRVAAVAKGPAVMSKVSAARVRARPPALSVVPTVSPVRARRRRGSCRPRGVTEVRVARAMRPGLIPRGGRKQATTRDSPQRPPTGAVSVQPSPPSLPKEPIWPTLSEGAACAVCSS
jgi:hypothetical protein